jgi:ATP adenylyltransferase
MQYIQSPKTHSGCIFCKALSETDDLANLVVVRGEHAFVILNRYPYTSGHIMVVPKAHQPSLDQLDSRTRTELIELTSRFTLVLQQVYLPQGFNIGINMGEAAGAGIVDHIHIHVVPRWMGDTNFMSTLGMTRVLPEALEVTYQRLLAGWDAMTNTI